MFLDQLLILIWTILLSVTTLGVVLELLPKFVKEFLHFYLTGQRIGWAITLTLITLTQWRICVAWKFPYYTGPIYYFMALVMVNIFSDEQKGFVNRIQDVIVLGFSFFVVHIPLKTMWDKNWFWINPKLRKKKRAPVLSR